jgi:hypothetical protein
LAKQNWLNIFGGPKSTKFYSVFAPLEGHLGAIFCTAQTNLKVISIKVALIQIWSIFDHFTTSCCPKNRHFLSKSILFFQQSIETQNFNFTHFFRSSVKSCQLKLQVQFCSFLLQKQGFCEKKSTLFYLQNIRTQIGNLHIIDPFMTKNKNPF